jgi:hypothetical protein
MIKVIKLEDKFNRFTDRWSPKIVTSFRLISWRPVCYRR